MSKICVLDTGYESYAYEAGLFGKLGHEFLLYEGDPGNREAQLAFAGDAVGILVRGSLIDRNAMARMPELKAIVRYGTGYENIDLTAARERGIRVANVQGYASDAVSDHAMALMYACLRGIGQPWPEQFGKPGRKEIFELHDKTLGIIGIGRIGSRFATKAAPLFRETLAFDPYKDSEYMKEAGAVRSGLDELLNRSHVISVHCSLTEETLHLLNRRTIGMMKKRPVVLNTARGPVIEETALLEALENGHVHSAGLDVFELEPPLLAEHRLLDHPHVIATPHVAWYSQSALRELQRRAAENMVALLQGRRIRDEIISPSR